MKKALIEALDENGNPIGKRLSKPDIHHHGYWHKSVHIWIYDANGGVLLQKRAKNKDSHPGLYDISCAGHVDAGEGPIDTCIREMEEEIGIRANKEDLQLKEVVKKSNYIENINWHNNQFNYEYLYKCDNLPNKFELEKDEVEEVVLMKIDDFEKEIKNPSSYKKYVPHGLEYYFKVIKWIREALV